MASPSDLRDRASVMEQSVTDLRDNATINQDMVALLKASVLSEVLPVLADLLELGMLGGTSSGKNPLREVMQRNNALRAASAEGDWDEVTRISDEYLDSIRRDASPDGPESSGEGSGS